MTATVVLGGHWGDEGKGKVIDLLADRFDFNVRYGGGANAGHTVVNGLGSFALHQVPSGVFHPGVTAMLSSGVVVDPAALIEEISELERRGIDLSKFYISERAHLVMPYHRVLDQEMERSRGSYRLGTTGKGMGPTYADKAAREGLRVGDMLNAGLFAKKVGRSLEFANLRLTQMYGAEPLDGRELLRQSCEWAATLAPRISDVERTLRIALKDGKSVVLEGAQGALLDIDAGSYPFVTSSSTGAAGACASAGIPPSQVSSVITVMHAYMTRVGAGPFPTELHDETAEHIRRQGQEFGTTTGRPRRCGWFDAVASKYVVDLNGASSLVLTKLDVLDGLDTIRICVGYNVDGQRIDYFPPSADALFKAEPVYEDLPGWRTPTRDAQGWEDLPEEARVYVRRLEELLEVEVSLLSVGPARHQTFTLRDPLAIR